MVGFCGFTQVGFRGVVSRIVHICYELKLTICRQNVINVSGGYFGVSIRDNVYRLASHTGRLEKC